jgi:hypothetical protein
VTGRPVSSPCVLAVIDAILAPAEELQGLARDLEHGELLNTVTPSRLVQLAAPLIATLADAEKQAHLLRAFVRTLGPKAAA